MIESSYDPDHLYHDHREADELRAEIERLRIENKNLQGDVMDSDHNELVRLRAKVDRLRTALKNVEIWATHPGMNPAVEISFIREIVAEAAWESP